MLQTLSKVGIVFQHILHSNKNNHENLTLLYFEYNNRIQTELTTPSKLVSRLLNDINEQELKSISQLGKNWFGTGR